MRVALLYGGSSSERFVSFLSAKSILLALKSKQHEVESFDPARLSQETDLEELSLQAYQKIDFYRETNPQHIVALFETLKVIEKGNFDIVFLALHGGYGEDGFVQDCLDRLGINYTGSNALSSKLAMDKHVSKQIMRQEKIKTANWILLNSNRFSMDEVEEKISFPCVVKPNSGGSSLALSIVEKKGELKKALDLAFKENQSVMIESYVNGRELTVSILNQRSYPVIEICPKNGMYDYEHKYTKGLTDYIVPAKIDEVLQEKLMNSAKHCFEALGMSVYGRVDFRLDEQNELYCLEANTLPGMTETSLVPKSLKAAGISFDDAVEMILQESLRRKN